VGVSNVVKCRTQALDGVRPPNRLGGWRGTLVLAGEREWPWPACRQAGLTLRALLPNSRGGVKVSSGALWSFVAREGLSFQKKPARPANRNSPTWPDDVSDEAPSKIGLIAASLDETWAKTIYPHAWTLTRAAARRQSPAWTLAHAHVPPALRCDKITAPCVFDGPIERQTFSLCRTAARSDALARRHRDHGQPRQSQGQSRARAIRAAGAKLFFLRPTVPISIQSSRSSASLKPPAKGAERSVEPSGDASHAFDRFVQPNAQTICQLRLLLRSEMTRSRVCT